MKIETKFEINQTVKIKDGSLWSIRSIHLNSAKVVSYLLVRNYDNWSWTCDESILIEQTEEKMM